MPESILVVSLAFLSAVIVASFVAIIAIYGLSKSDGEIAAKAVDLLRDISKRIL